MKSQKFKMILIKKIRDIIFLLCYGRGNYLFYYFKTLISTVFYYTFNQSKKKFEEKHKGKFSNSWFNENLKYLFFFLSEKQKDFKKILEIGSFEGNSTLFFLNYFKNSLIHCVDIWEDQKSNYKGINFSSIEDKFDYNIKEYKSRINKWKSSSKNYFKYNNVSYDLIFIDGSHYYKDVYLDAINSFKFCKINGYILFDDYLFKYKSKKNAHPIFAINKFLKKYKNKIKIIAVYRQVLIKKISQ